MVRNLRAKPCTTLRESSPGIRASSTRRVVRSTTVPTAEPLARPLMMSPSQCPGINRASTSIGRAAIGVGLGMSPRLSPTSVTAAAHLTMLAQTTDQRTPQLAARNDINRRVDGFVGDSLFHVLRVIASQPCCNLLWRPTLLQAPSNIATQPPIGHQLARSAGNARAPLRTPLRHRGAVARRTFSVTPQLAAHRRSATPQLPGDQLHAEPQGDSSTDFLAFHRTQLAIAGTHGNTSVANGKSVALHA